MKTGRNIEITLRPVRDYAGELRLGVEIEHDEVFGGIVEQTLVELEPVVVELAFRVILRGNATVEVCNAESVSIEHNADYTVDVDRVI